MKKIVIVLATLLIASVAFAQQSPTGQGASVLNGGIVENWSNVAPGAGPNNNGGPGLGRHDLWNGVTGSPLGCETCHLPHTAPTYGKAFLWAWRNVPTTVNTYVSDTNKGPSMAMSNTRSAQTRSILCMTCHDSVSASANSITGGVVLAGSPYALVSSVGGVADLSSQHPVDALVPPNIDYQQPVAVSTGLPGSPDSATAFIGLTAQLPLWGADFRVECSSCHDQHNDYTSDQGTAGGYPFLRVANTNGVALCRQCHNK